MAERMQTIRFLLGKSPRADTVFPHLFAELAARGIGTEVVLPHEANAVGPLRPPALAVQRGLRSAVMDRLARLETEGWRFCNSVAASRAAQDRGRVWAALRAAGLTVPDAMLLHDWLAGAQTSGKGAVVKAADGRVGRGGRVAFVEAGGWPAEPPFPGPRIVEERIASDGTDRSSTSPGGPAAGC